MKTPKVSVLLLLFLWMLAVLDVCAQEHAGSVEKDAPHKVWYGGIEGGVPFGVSTLSSFGADKTRAGYALGLFGGYQFNPVLSVELSAKWGKANLSARDCCTENGYWLGADGVTYHAPVAGFDGADYADLKSAVSLQQYGVRLNVNLLGLFLRTKQSRWRLELSPMIAAVGTKADIQTIATGSSLIEGKTRWHLGGGGNLQASYAVTDKLHLGVYSGITCLSGRGMDGVAPRVHDGNFLWESGLRISLALGKGRKQAKPIEVQMPIIKETPVEEIGTPVPQEPEVETATDEDETLVGTTDEELVFPVIYFDFNKSDIRVGEMTKLQEICHILQTNPGMRISITGWCDPAGNISVNNRISLCRAEAVRAWLIDQGIDASRMEVQGMGIDHNEPDASKARRVIVADVNEKEVKP